MMLRAGKISPDNLVWTEGLSDWTPAGQTEAFRSQGPS